MSQIWPDDKLDRGALEAAARAYVLHFLDGAPGAMGVAVLVVNRETGQFHWASSLSTGQTRELFGKAREQVPDVRVVRPH